MTWTVIMLAAVIFAQPPAAAGDQATERAEDVEVMRRILNRAIGLPNEPTPMASTMPGGFHHFGSTMLVQPSSLYQPLGSDLSFTLATRLADPFDGVYLRGHGVVYTLKIRSGEQYHVEKLRRHAGLASGCKACHSDVPVPAVKLEPAAPSRAEPTEWDRTRDALRGVKEPAPTEPTPTVAPKDVCRPGQLTEALMTALMKNGRHIRHLAAGDSVTLVVTLDGLYGPARVATAADGTAVMEFFLANQPATAPPSAPKQDLKYDRWFMEEEAKQITLGDLHQKQGKPKEAAEAYRKALARFAAKGLQIEANHPVGPEAVHGLVTDVEKGVREVHAKLARALIEAGDLDGARSALDAARSLKVKLTQPPAAGPAALPVPAKLVLTVKKADLDRAEKLTPAEFRKLVAVETTGLPPADRAKK